MNARRVHAVLAAGVENPELIARWRREPQLLRRQGVDPRGVDLDGLWRFAGLTVKVRHNGLRADFPMTFRLLNVAGLEIEVFASYAAERAAQGKRYAATAEARTRDLIDFLEHWLDLDRAEHSLLWDMIRHERALAQLGGSAPVLGVEGGASCAPTIRSVPRVRGKIILHEMRCDPRAVVALLRERTPQLQQIPLETAYFCYWRAETTREIRILSLDAFGFYALSFVDGIGSVALLNRRLGGVGKPTPSFLRLLGRLGAIGILDFERSR